MTGLRNFTLVLLLAFGIIACGGGSEANEPESGAGMKIGTNFWDLTFRGGATWDDIFLPGVDFSTVVNPWKPEFLDELAHYRVFRFVEFGKINSSTEQQWADRTQKTDPRPAQERLAYEWMIDLCNRTGTDMWVTLPAQANDAYALELAKLIEANLDPSLAVYVEWSNETWNSGFSQKQYAIDQGVLLGLDPDPGTAGAKFHVYRALQVFSLFETVFGAGNPRIVRVIAGQSVNTFVTSTHLAALADPAINPSAMSVDAYAIAPYFGHGLDGSAIDIVSQLEAAIVDAVAKVRSQHALIEPTGMQLIAYEGGQHVNINSDGINASPVMYRLYTDYLNGMAPYFTIFTHFVHNGQWGAGGSWGAESYVGQPLAEAHKLRAILDWIAAHP